MTCSTPFLRSLVRKAPTNLETAEAQMYTVTWLVLQLIRLQKDKVSPACTLKSDNMTSSYFTLKKDLLIFLRPLSTVNCAGWDRPSGGY